MAENVERLMNIRIMGETCMERTRENMKYYLADALKRCMKRAPLEKVTVGEIAEECGTSRQTFYRHFKDKYDLVNWYFDKILQESFEHMGGKGVRFSRGLSTNFNILKRNGCFLKRHSKMMPRII